jgi:hypothetical protein
MALTDENPYPSSPGAVAVKKYLKNGVWSAKHSPHHFSGSFYPELNGYENPYSNQG